MIYEWDPSKAAANKRKRAVSFEEAQSVFLDPLAETFEIPTIRLRRTGLSRSA